MDSTRQAAIDALVAEIDTASRQLKELRVLQKKSESVMTTGDDMYLSYRLTAAARALAVLTSPQGL